MRRSIFLCMTYSGPRDVGLAHWFAYIHRRMKNSQIFIFDDRQGCNLEYWQLQLVVFCFSVNLGGKMAACYPKSQR